MKHLKISLFNLFFLLLIGSCTPFVEYDVDEKASKLVINAILYNDSLTVHLSKSTSPFGTTMFADLLVNNGKITLTDLTTNQTYNVPFQKNGRYKLFLAAKENHLYKIEAEAVGFENANSKQVLMPEKVQFEILNFSEIEPLSQNGEKAVAIKIKLKDQKPEKNYYAFNAYLFPLANNYGFLTNLDEIATSCDFVGNFLSDKCFNQTDFTLEYFSEYLDQKEITFELASVSQSYFEYQKSLPQPSNIETAFIEPNYRYSNIQNGYGVFVAKNATLKTYKLF